MSEAWSALASSQGGEFVSLPSQSPVFAALHGNLHRQLATSVSVAPSLACLTYTKAGVELNGEREGISLGYLYGVVSNPKKPEK